MIIRLFCNKRPRGINVEILLTQMRREGFEMTVSPPKVLIKLDKSGKKQEPIEEITMDLDEEYSSRIIDSMNKEGEADRS